MILDELYFCNMEKTPPTLEYWQTARKLEPYQEKIKASFGFAFLDEYIALNSQLIDITARQSYRAGAGFALRFLLETLLFP